MSFLSKVELKKQLHQMGISIKGNYVKKSDIAKVIAKREYAKVVWAPDDIQTLRDWSLEECENWLIENEKQIQDAIVSLGWEVIESLL